MTIDEIVRSVGSVRSDDTQKPSSDKGEASPAKIAGGGGRYSSRQEKFRRSGSEIGTQIPSAALDTSGNGASKGDGKKRGRSSGGPASAELVAATDGAADALPVGARQNVRGGLPR